MAGSHGIVILDRTGRQHAEHRSILSSIRDHRSIFQGKKSPITRCSSIAATSSICLCDSCPLRRFQLGDDYVLGCSDKKGAVLKSSQDDRRLILNWLNAWDFRKNEVYLFEPVAWSMTLNKRLSLVFFQGRVKILRSRCRAIRRRTNAWIAQEWLRSRDRCPGSNAGRRSRHWRRTRESM